MAVRQVSSRTWKRWLNGEVPLARAMTVRPEVREGLLWEASKRLEDGRIVEASRLFSLVAVFWPDEPDGPLGMGACSMKQDEINEAVEHFHAAEKTDGSNPYALANLAECALIQGNPEEATRLLDRIDRSDDKRRADLRERLASLRQVVSTSTPPVG